jgi:hypothetical protein
LGKYLTVNDDGEMTLKANSDVFHGSRGGGSLHSVVTTETAGFMSGTDKTKLDGIEAGAEVNQNAFSTIAVSGQSNVVADGKTDTLTMVGGSNITITTDAENDSVTITSSAQANQNTFSIVAVSGQSNIEADATTDTLNMAAGNLMELTTNATTDTLTIGSGLLSLPGADHGYIGNKIVRTIHSASTVAFGTPLYVAADGELEPANATTASTCPCLFLATSASTGSQTVIGAGSVVRDDTWNWTIGNMIYLSATVGTLTQTRPTGTGHQVQPVGVALSADVMFFLPSISMGEVS